MASRLNRDHFYTDAENNWLIQNINKHRYKDLVGIFNETFNTNLTYDAITSHCLRTLQIKRGKENQYGFSKGKQTTKHTLPIGTERWDGVNVWVKVSDDVVEEQNICNSKRSNPNWQLKKRLVWESHYGRIPDNMIIICLNKDEQDCSIENLYVTTRKINFMMAKNHWYSENRELTRTALKWCELFYALKG